MRIDKYIWLVRLVKTRSIATKLCQQEKVMLNEQLVKGSKTIKIDQVFALKHGAFWRTYKILNLPKGRLGAKLVPEYLTETTSKQILDQITAIESANRQNRIDGFIGRPTKKNRRDLDKFSDW